MGVVEVITVRRLKWLIAVVEFVVERSHGERCSVMLSMVRI